jgi:hypothetical protein
MNGNGEGGLGSAWYVCKSFNGPVSGKHLCKNLGKSPKYLEISWSVRVRYTINLLC